MTSSFANKTSSSQRSGATPCERASRWALPQRDWCCCRRSALRRWRRRVDVRPTSWVWIERTSPTQLDIAVRDFDDDYDADQPLDEDKLHQEVEVYIKTHHARGQANKVYMNAPPEPFNGRPGAHRRARQKGPDRGGKRSADGSARNPTNTPSREVRPALARVCPLRHRRSVGQPNVRVS